jgi:hypothetical protein
MPSKSAHHNRRRSGLAEFGNVFGRIRAVFGNERSFWRLCAVAFGVISIMKGLRFPNAWALTQAQLGYSHGFVKRGLLGELNGVLGIRHRILINGISLLEFLLFVAVLAWLTYRSGLEERVGNLAIVTLFTSSYVLTFMAHLAGYTDIVLATLAILLLLVRSTPRRFYAGLVVVPAAILIHESFLLMYLPVVLFSFVLDGALEPDCVRRRKAAVYALALMMAGVCVTLFAGLAGRMSSAQVDQFHDEVLSRVDFTPQEEFFMVLKASFWDNLGMGSQRFLTLRWYGVLLLAVCLLGPVLISILYFGRRLLLQRMPATAGVWRRYVPVAALFAIVVPESMHLLGIDALRWYACSVLAAYLCLATLSMRLPQGTIRFTAADLRWILFVVALNLSSGFGLYNHMQIRPYPFFPTLFQ